MVERLLDAERILHRLLGGERVLRQRLALFHLREVLRELLQRGGGLILRLGRVLERLRLLRRGRVWLRGLLDVLGNLRRLLPHLGKADVRGAGHLPFRLALHVGMIGLLSQRALEIGELFAVFFRLRSQRVRLLRGLLRRLVVLGGLRDVLASVRRTAAVPARHSLRARSVSA